MSSGNHVFQLRQATGWSRGLDNLLEVEMGRWFRTRKWWVQILVWAGLINSILALVVIGDGVGGSAELAMLLNIFLGIFAAIGVCVLMQGVVVGEKQSGTVAWILSKPVSRPAFLLAKLAANVVGIVVTILLAQGLIAYVLIFLASNTLLPPLGYLGGLSAQLVHLLFYITLSLVLGTVFNGRGPVIGITVAVIFVQELAIGLLPGLVNVLPQTVAVPLDSEVYPSIATALMTRSQPQTYLPLVTTLALSALFVAVALWAFERLDF